MRMAVAWAPLLISAVLRLLSWTLRVRFENAERLFSEWDRHQVILAFWHNRLLMMPVAARGRRICIMNSQSRDGEIATRTLQRWGIHSVRGSATRGGTAGFLQLVRAFRQGYTLAIVPDGPRGPRYEVKPGILHLARATGARIYPVSYGASRFRQIGSWDRLIIPLPFARVTYVIGDPLEVGRDAGEKEIAGLRTELEARMNRITAQADGMAKRRPR
jgi:lysophospholipid acyltransferase (LPLAT)-like uncharacterized protein